MCAPIVAAGIAMAATALSTISANQAAHQQNKALQAQNTLQKKQIDQQATDEINQRLRAMRREQARIQVAAGEAGLSLGSGSVEAQLFDSMQQAEISNDTSIANRESRKMASDATTASRLQSKTTALGAALKIGLAGAGAYAGSEARTSNATARGN